MSIGRRKYVNKLRLFLGGLCIFLAMSTFSGCGSEQDETEQQSETKQQEDQGKADDYQEIAVGSSVPDFTAETTAGESFVLSEQRGKVVLLNFWATWCGPCVRELPAFERLYKEYGQEIAILAIDCMEDKDTVDQFVSGNGYTFPIAYDEEGKIAEKYPTDGIPYTLVIGKDGIAKKIYLGASDADEQYEEYKNAIVSALHGE